MESLNKDGEMKNVMYRAEHFQKMIKPILLKLDRNGVLDFQNLDPSFVRNIELYIFKMLNKINGYIMQFKND